MTDSEARSGMVLALAEEFLERYRKGQRPSLKEYIDRHPDLAPEIREVLPAMAMMEKIALADESLDGDPTMPRYVTPATPPIEQLGDYRIIREVGHGGMGVVYEAEQVSLGRHVALKVLPQQMLLDRKQKLRFERESKAAARLHHTNIVPVFGVGEQDGLPYYVMQFIQGLGLDAVLEELKRVRRGGPWDGASTAVGELRVSRRDFTAADVAQSLMAGRFEFDGAGARAELESLVAIDADAPTMDASRPVSDGRPPGATGRVADSFSVSSSGTSSLILQGNSGKSRHGKTKASTFWQTVARLGVQVADALAYAHQQGILHRDIKPSNLLLDTRGTVWVTDFGLAKADDQQNLTHTGDILGTLRYMPPEAFEGKTDARGDVYALGMTLYELLAFQPAFDEKDRGRLIRQVTTEEAPRLERVNREVPRDLVTIVHKAIERDPEHRYSTAGELSADLQRFIDDEPILARRVSSLELLERWARHNKLVAASLTAIGVLLAVIAIGASVAAARSQRAARDNMALARDKESERKKAVEAKKEADLGRARQAELRRQAEANFAIARRAVDDSFTKVSESRLLKVPGLQPLRRELLESALTFYREFLESRADEPALRAELAATQLRIGRICTELGIDEDARKALQAAIAAYDDALKSNPKNIELQDALADAWEALGDLAYQEKPSPNRSRAMLRAYERTTAVRDALAHAQPTNVVLQKKLAVAWNRLGVGQSAMSRPADAFESYRRSSEIRQSLIRDFPDDPELHYGLGESFLNLGVLLKDRDRAQEALDAFRRSEEHYQLACRALPHVLEYGFDLGSAYQEACAVLARLGRKEEACEQARLSVSHLRKMAHDNPAVPAVQSRLIASLNDLARAENQLGDSDAAAQTFSELGELLGSLPKDSPDDLYYLACVHAQISSLIAPNSPKPAVGESLDAAREAALAVSFLKRSVQAGFRNVNRLTVDRELSSVRDRNDFKALVADVESKAKAETAAREAAERSVAERSKTDTQPDRQRQPLTGDAAAYARIRADLAANRLAVGMIQLDLGQMDNAWASLAEAIAIRDRLVADDPQNARYRADLGLSHVARGNFLRKADRLADAAQSWRLGLDQLDAAVHIDPADSVIKSQLATAEVSIGKMYASFGLWREAAALYAGSLARKPPGHSLEWYEHTLLCLLVDDSKGYAATCEQMQNAFGRLAEPAADFDLIRACTLRGNSLSDWAPVVARADRTSKESPTNGWHKAALGFALYRGGRYADALEALRDPAAAGVFTTGPIQSICLFRIGRVDDARQVLRESDQRLRRMSRECLAQGYFGGEKTFWQDWAQFWLHAQEAHALIQPNAVPGTLEIAALRARLYMKLGEPKKAAAECESMAAVDADDPATWLMRGHVFAQLGQQAEANADYAKAADLKAGDAFPWVEHGRFLAERGDRAQADAAFSKAAALASGDLSTFLQAGWWVVAPYPEDLAKSCTPEDNPDPARPVAAASGPVSIAWRWAPTGTDGRVDLRAVFNADHISAYALNYIYAPEDRTATLLIGGDDHVSVWLNGRLVHEIGPPKTSVSWPWTLHHVPVALRAGRNTLLAKISQKTDAHVLYCRLADGPIDRGFAFAELGLWEEASALFSKVFDEGLPEDRWLWDVYPRMLLAAGDTERFRQHRARVIERLSKTTDVSDGNLLNCVCSIAPFDSGIDSPHLIAMTERWLESGPREGWRVDRLGVTMFRAGRYDDASKLFAEARSAEYEPHWPVLAMTAHRRGRTSEAQTWRKKANDWFDRLCEDAIAGDGYRPPYASTWWDRAWVECTLREANALINGTTPQLDPRSIALQTRARAILKGFDKATADFDLAILVHPDDPRLRLARAQRYADLKREADAERDFAQAVELAPDDPEVWRERARVRTELGQADRAAADLAHAAALLESSKNRRAP